MDLTRFKQIISSFADSAEQFEIKKGTLTIELGSDVISAELNQRGDGLFVIEDGISHRAEHWIVHRIAQLHSLADRILTHVADVSTFVIPKAEVLSQVDESPIDSDLPVESAVDALVASLEKRPGGTCSVLYLTSDAGEGKTTVINHLARLQAQRFREKQSDWLLVPISLGGRPFLRFDDVFVAALMNQLDFNVSILMRLWNWSRWVFSFQPLMVLRKFSLKLVTEMRCQAWERL